MFAIDGREFFRKAFVSGTLWLVEGDGANYEL